MNETIRSRDHVCDLHPKPGAPRVVIFSLWNDKYAPLADIARPNWAAYAARHGYALCFYPGLYHEDPSRPETFGDKGKFQCYYDLRGHADVVMFLDIDSLFMNMDVTVEETLSNPTVNQIALRQMADTFRPLNPFLWTYDDNGPLSGLWIARTDDTTEKHLRFAYTFAARERNVRHDVIEPNGISDQDAMRALMNVPPFRDTFQHCYPAADVGHCFEQNYEPGKWIITFPGIPVEQKLERMRKYANVVA